MTLLLLDLLCCDSAISLTFLQEIMQQFGNLVKLCENIERDFFERSNSEEDGENGNFVKLP